MNTMIDNLPILKGEVYFLFESGQRAHHFQKDNAIVPNAKAIIAHSLGGDSSYIIDTIQVYLGANLLASTTVSKNYPTNDTVKFSGVFLEGSFSGDFDRLVLKSSLNGEFSELTGTTYNKLPEEKLTLGWVIKPN